MTTKKNYAKIQQTYSNTIVAKLDNLTTVHKKRTWNVMKTNFYHS